MIYIANTTKQDWVFCYRAPETNRAQMVHIPSGKQAEIGQGWTVDQTRAVVGQLESFGGKAAVEVNGHLEKFPGLLYRLEKPVTEDQIVDGHEAVVDHQERRSAAEATRSALAFDAVNREKKGRGKRLAKVTEVTVEQDIPARQKPTGDEVRFSLQVSEEGRADVALPV